MIIYNIFVSGDIIESINKSLNEKVTIIFIISGILFSIAFAYWLMDKDYIEYIVVGFINIILFLVLRKYYIVAYIILVVLKVINRWLDII